MSKDIKELETKNCEGEEEPDKGKKEEKNEKRTPTQLRLPFML